MSRQSPQVAAFVRSHEELFLARYALLLGRALRLTEGDRARAEDLVQDAFVHFTVARPDLARIENLDGYLHVMLRNLHTSQMRREARRGERSLSAVEYDSAEMSLRATDPRELVRAQDELRACCRYACARKETSKAGSVLILRFFHGYYPREIAQILKGSRESVEERLRVARGEARQFLKDPSALRFMRGGRDEELRLAPSGYALDAQELLADLRRAIFDSRRGACVSVSEMEKIYLGKESAGGVETKTLAHIVSCPRCIDEVNRLTGLAPLSERYPTDTTGADARAKDGGDGGDGNDAGGGASTGGATEDQIRRCRTRARDVFEHQPRELCVAVNGRVLASQKTGASRCEQRLAVTLPETVEFVEVFSEQEVRLLLLEVNEHFAGDDGRRLSACVSLSDERRLEATLDFEEPWPTVQVVYDDAPLAFEAAARAEKSPAVEGARTPILASVLSKPSSWFANLRFLLRPVPLTAALAVVVAAALLLTRVSVPAVSAAELLTRSASAEDTLASDARLVIHRTFHLEESAPRGATLARHRVEVWTSAARGVKVRRVFDRENRLVAGEWESTADGAHRVFAPGTRARESATRTDAKSLVEAGELWRLDLSAKTFSALVGDARSVSVDDNLGAYTLDYRAQTTDETDGAIHPLVGATLRLSKADLRATVQTLTVRRGAEEHEYRFVEGGFEKLQTETVAPAVFEPDAELVRGETSAQGADATLNNQSGAPSRASDAGNGTSAMAVASEELEVEVAYLLSRIKADLGEQVSWTRTTGGQLRVEALAETEGRKQEILRALGPVINNPAVIIDVSTVAERARRTRSSDAEESVREVEVRTGRIPADAELRRYFAARGVGDDHVEGEIRRLASRAMSRSRQALLHASALKRLASRFQPEEVRALSAEARAKWLAMVREHAQGVVREVRALEGELRPVFPHAKPAGRGVDASDALRAAERLLELSYSTDETVRSAFAASSDASGAARLRSQQFWRALGEAENLANAIEAAYNR